MTRARLVRAVGFPEVMFGCESWAIKKAERRVFRTVMLEKALESQPVHSKGNKPCIFFGRTDAEAEAPALWLPDVKNCLIGKDLNAGKD